MPRIVSVYVSSAKKRDTSGNLCFVCGADAYDKLRVFLLAGEYLPYTLVAFYAIFINKKTKDYEYGKKRSARKRQRPVR